LEVLLFFLPDVGCESVVDVSDSVCHQESLHFCAFFVLCLLEFQVSDGLKLCRVVVAKVFEVQKVSVSLSLEDPKLLVVFVGLSLKIANSLF
jgi:hypothetical protein